MPRTKPASSGNHRGPARQATGPTVAVIAIAVGLQMIVLTIAPRTSGAGILGTGSHSALDFAMSRNLAIPGLAPSLITRLAGEAFQPAPRPAEPGPGPHQSVQSVSATGPTPTRPTPSASPRPPPSPSPTHTPAPAPSPSPILQGADKVITFMTVNKTKAGPNESVIYQIVARNSGSTNFGDTFIIDTHTPQFTQRCGVLITTSCSVAGDYDGSSTASGDTHTNPPTTTVSKNVPAHSDVVLLTLPVQVTADYPKGTVLHNHAHVDVTGSAQGLVTSLAPDVVLTGGLG